MRKFQEAFGPRKREAGGSLVRRDGVRILTWERSYLLLTPLFGGGVEPKRADPVSVVRATEVRGQLRFWWRAVRGWQAEGDLGRLWRLEASLFGHAGEGGASPLAVELEVVEEGKEEAAFQDLPGKNFPRGRSDIAHPYLAFPLQRTRQDPVNYPVRVGVRFRLRLACPERIEGLDPKEELEAALWAWETFGGIGGRTRRGFGALALEGSSPPTEEGIRAQLRRYSRERGWPPGVPHLTPKSLVRVMGLSWREVAEAYRAFRQRRAKDDPRNPGRSRWPEPDQVRRLTGRNHPRHPPRHPVGKFPRARFGLPIIFHFKDEGDPPDTTLKPPLEGTDRLASPLILRPLGKGITLVAILEGSGVPGDRAVLETHDKKRSWEVQVGLTPEEAQRIEPLGGEVDPLRAFLRYLENRAGGGR